MQTHIDRIAHPRVQMDKNAGVGWQYVLDLYGCTAQNIDDVGWVRATMLQAAAHAGGVKRRLRPVHSSLWSAHSSWDCGYSFRMENRTQVRVIQSTSKA
jgi:hypothetical protein